MGVGVLGICVVHRIFLQKFRIFTKNYEKTKTIRNKQTCDQKMKIFCYKLHVVVNMVMNYILPISLTVSFGALTVGFWPLALKITKTNTRKERLSIFPG